MKPKMLSSLSHGPSSFGPAPLLVPPRPEISATRQAAGGANGATMAPSSSLAQSSCMTLSLEKLLEAAALSGELALAGRNLKAFPRVKAKSKQEYDLRDTVSAGRTVWKNSMIMGHVNGMMQDS